VSPGNHDLRITFPESRFPTDGCNPRVVLLIISWSHAAEDTMCSLHVFLRALPLVGLGALTLSAQGRGRGAQPPRPEDTEIWQPIPRVVAPGRSDPEPPRDAIVLFDGRSIDQWVSARDGSPARWKVADGVMTVDKPSGDIRTRRTFRNYQLHIEWRVPAGTTGSGQARGNSGVYLAATNGPGGGYEIQILDSYNNATYVNGQAASIYKQHPPLVNAMRPPGEWQT
jgi:hypothetical protein